LQYHLKDMYASIYKNNRNIKLSVPD